jgi:hypothetical protein
MLKSTKNGLASRVLGADQIPNKNILVTSDSIVMTEDRPASATSAGVVSTGAQSFAGDKTFTGQATFAGGTVGVTATATNTEINVVAFPSSVGSGGGVWSETGTVFDSGLSTTSTAGDLPLAGVTSTAIKMTANASSTEATNYVSTTLTMPATLLNRKLKVDIWMRPGTGFASSEWTVSVYSGSTRMALSTDSSGVTYLPNATGKFVTTFDADSSATYTLRFARVSGSGSATLNVCNVIVGPGIQPQGAVVESWKSNTTMTFGGEAGATLPFVNYYRRVGDSVDVYLKVAVTNKGTSSGTFTIVLPPGLTIDATKINTTANGQAAVGSGVQNTSTVKGVTVCYNTSTAVELQVESGSAALTWAGITNGDIISVKFTVPISEWSGSGTVNLAQNDVEFASNNGSGGTTAGATYDTGMVYGPSGSNIVAIGSTTAGSSTAYRVSFQTPIQITDALVIEIDDANGGWIPVYEYGAAGIRSLRNEADSYYGVGIYKTSTATDCYVVFGNKGAGPYGVNGTAFAANGNAWSSYTSRKWRVRKTSAGAAVGFGLATSNSAGLLNYYQEDDTTLASVAWKPNGAGSTIGTAFAIKITRIGRMVNLHIPENTSADPAGTTTVVDLKTSGDSAVTLPIWARPTTERTIPIVIRDTSQKSGVLTVDSLGALTLSLVGGGTWSTGTNVCGVFGTSATYIA